MGETATLSLLGWRHLLSVGPSPDKHMARVPVMLLTPGVSSLMPLSPVLLLRNVLQLNL